jgi:hypothetical protein
MQQEYATGRPMKFMQYFKIIQVIIEKRTDQFLLIYFLFSSVDTKKALYCYGALNSFNRIGGN